MLLKLYLRNYSTCYKFSIRWLSLTTSKLQFNSSSTALIYHKNGEPCDVITEVKQKLDFNPESSDVHIQYLSAVIHPSDINTIQGVYGIRPKLPSIPGNEGSAKVLAVGSKVSSLRVGDLVVPLGSMLGTWTTHSVLPETHLFRVHKDLPPNTAAIITANPGTAYRLLHDFVKLKPGDFLIQTGATSAVGIYVIQLARMLGVKTVNIIRSRETPEATQETKAVLMEFGADEVWTEEEMRGKRVEGDVRLGLTCQGGKPSVSVLKALGDEGVMVCYGAMNKQPVQVGVSPLIFKDVSVRGFWFSRWKERSLSLPAWPAMMTHLQDLFLSGQLRPSPFTETPFSQWSQALTAGTFKDGPPSVISKKQLFDMTS